MLADRYGLSVRELREHLAAGNLPAGQVVARQATVNVARFSAEPALQ